MNIVTTNNLDVKEIPPLLMCIVNNHFLSYIRT